MLANQDRTRLIYSAGYGYTKAQEDLLQGTEFHLDNPESRGMFVRAYREQKPFLINDINEVEKTLSDRSLELARRMGVRSLLSVPVVYEKASLGVVAVDNVDSKRSFTQSDVSLLMGVASQTAVSITNAISFQKLRESEKKYRELVENANSIILRRDPRGEVTFFNEFAQAFFGYSEEEIVGKNVVGTIVPEKESTGRDLATMVRDIGRDPEKYANNENENVRHNGDRVWVAWTNKAIRDRYGQIVEILCVGNDITARKQAEEALRESEEKYRNILESMEEGYFEADPAGNLTFFNDALCRMSGYPPEELIGMNNREYMNEENAKRIYRVFNKVYETGKPARVREYEIMSKDGRPRTFEMSTSLIRDDAGNPLGFRGVVRDVSKRLEAEKEKAKLEAHLQRARKMEAIGALAGGVAHDLNNILTALVSYPELLLIKLPEESPMKRPLQTIKKSGEKAAAIVQDLLTLARRGVAVTEVTDLNAIISEYLTSPEYKKLISFHPEVRLKVKLDPSLLNILGSPVHLSKTVMNLVSNGAEAMPEGGVIHITTENRYVDAPIKGYDEIKQGDYATLTVSDTGIGISPDDMERIFEPFYTKKVMGRSGTGLGMAVVWGTVRDHKGYIDVESRQGKGSRFTLYFPVIRQAVEREEDRLAVENYRGNGESVLVVDDVEEQREIATGMLEELGYSVTAVPSGEEAVAYLKAHSVDLVLLDMIMDPGMDGLETYRRICRDHPGQRAVIVSGYSESDRVKEAQLLGAGPYVKKPYLLEAIGGAVRAELDK
jgi:PAS domain S-box-containing protein